MQMSLEKFYRFVWQLQQMRTSKFGEENLLVTFFVRSAYKLLQEATLNPISIHTETKACYKKLQNLQIPPKVKITIWRKSWNYIPTFVNLKIRRVVVDARCPRCNQDEEDSNHVSCRFPTTTEVWRFLKFSWILYSNIDSVWNWLTWVFSQGTNKQYHLFCCGLWIIWTSRNKLIYENKQTTSKDILTQISRYISELRGVEKKTLILEASRGPKSDKRRTSVAIYFDAAFD